MLITTGCAVDNEFLAKMPLFEARSDKIPGLDPPYERKKQIRLKGEKGATAPDAEKEVIVAQLIVEYQTSPDPNMRREAVDALAKIPYSKRDQFMKEILKDDVPFVRLSAMEALDKTFNGQKEELAEVLIDHLKTDADKDVRLAAVRVLGNITAANKKGEPASEGLRNHILNTLGDALYDKVPAIRYESMQSLHKITGKDYGNDINRWIQYVRYTKGEISDVPAERSFSEKMPKLELPMLK
jgi:HEAT repeat protein